MQTKAKGASRRVADPHADMRKAAPSDAPLAIVYLAIICCAVIGMIVARRRGGH